MTWSILSGTVAERLLHDGAAGRIRHRDQRSHLCHLGNWVQSVIDLRWASGNLGVAVSLKEDGSGHEEVLAASRGLSELRLDELTGGSKRILRKSRCTEEQMNASVLTSS